MTDEQCLNCKYFMLQFESQSSGSCHHSPPDHDGWPSVMSTAWCGKYVSAAAAEKVEAAAELKSANDRFVPNAVYLAPDPQAPTAHEVNKTICNDCEEYHHPSGKCKLCNGGTLYSLAGHLQPCVCTNCVHYLRPAAEACAACVDKHFFKAKK